MEGCMHSTHSPFVTLYSLVCLETTSRLVLADSSWQAVFYRDMEGPEERGGETVYRSGQTISLSCIAEPLSPAIARKIMSLGTLSGGSGVYRISADRETCTYK